MKIHLQTKRGLNTLKFGGYSEILTLFLRGNWKSGYNVSILLLLYKCYYTLNLQIKFCCCCCCCTVMCEY